MLIMLNGYPGVGKLTIARELVGLVGGRLLDNHSIYNIAFALTDFKSAAFYEAVRSAQRLADDLIAALPDETPIILTEALSLGSEWTDECWRRVLRLSESRGQLFVVHVLCDLHENRQRIQSQDRAERRKPRDPAMAERYHALAKPLVGGDADHCLRLDVTELSEAEAAGAIFSWIERTQAT